MRHPVDRYVNRLLRRRRPRSFAPTEDELGVVRTAIDLIAAAPGADEPRPAFVDRLHARLAELEQGEQSTDTDAPHPAWRITARRRVLAAGALTATGVAFGVGADRLVVIAAGVGDGDGDGDDGGRPSLPQAGAGGTTGSGAGNGSGNGSGNGAGTGSGSGPDSEISPASGVWRTVADSVALSEGAVLPFDLGAVNGFVRRVSGRAQAVSGICTHQGCRLDLSPTRDLLSCPCHGATFTLAGANLTHPLQTGQSLPALPRLAVREQNGQVQIYAPRSS